MSEKIGLFERYLAEQDDAAWARVLDELRTEMHPVDERATRIWFAFFPVKLHRVLSSSPDPEQTAQSLLLKGKYRVSDQIDTSAEFLYGHRHWPAVRREVAEYVSSAEPGGSPAGHIREVARRVAAGANVEQSLLTGITAVAFGTLQQVGYDSFRGPAQPGDYGKKWKRSPDQIVADRQKDDQQGVFGFLRSVDKQYSVTFREHEPGCAFKLLNLQDVTTAAQADKREHHLKNPRCKQGEGPIPVECRTAACGTCWVGVLSPTEKISPPNDREINRWVYFGYEGFTGEPDSPIRLACQMKAHGNVTIVIPPWHGNIGKMEDKKDTAAA